VVESGCSVAGGGILDSLTVGVRGFVGEAVVVVSGPPLGASNGAWSSETTETSYLICVKASLGVLALGVQHINIIPHSLPVLQSAIANSRSLLTTGYSDITQHCDQFLWPPAW